MIEPGTARTDQDREDQMNRLRRMSLHPPDEQEEEVIVYATPGIRERGFLLTHENIQELRRSTLIEKAREFYSDFIEIPIPSRDFNEMSTDDLKSWLLDVCSRDDVQNEWKTGIEEREFTRKMSGLVYEHPNGKLLLDIPKIADYLRNEFKTISFNDGIYIYDRNDGIYRRNSGELEEEFRKIVEHHNIKCKVRNECADTLFFVKNSNQVKDADPFNNEPNMIPVKNGLVKIDPITGTAVLIPHSPEYKFKFKLPWNYKPDIDTEPMMEILRSWVPESDIPFIIQPVAQALVQMMTRGQLKKATLLQGQTNGGKSTYVNFVETFLGDKLAERSTLTELCDSRFVGSKLENKLLCCAEELKDTKLTNSDTFKGLLGDGRHRIERKHENPYTSFLFCSYLFACNVAPKLDDDTTNDDAWWSRWNFVIFPYYYDTNLEFKNTVFTEDNFERFLKLVIDMASDIIKNGYRLKYVMDSDIVRARWTLKMNLAGQYIEECFDCDTKHHDYDPDEIFKHCVEWCQEKRIDNRKIPKNRNQLTRDIKEWLVSTPTTIPDPDNKTRKISVRVYRGNYRIKDADPDKFRPAKPDDELTKYLS